MLEVVQHVLEVVEGLRRVCRAVPEAALHMLEMLEAVLHVLEALEGTQHVVEVVKAMRRVLERGGSAEGYARRAEVVEGTRHML